MRTPHLPFLRASTVAIVTALVLGATPAHADATDIPLLTGILTSLGSQLVQVTQALQTAKAAYQTTETIAGYAGDAVQAYNQFKSLNGKLFGQNVEDSLNAAFPDIAYFNNQLSHNATWDQSTGALQPQLVMCFNDLLNSANGVTIAGGKCATIRQGLQVDQVAGVLTQVFGDVAPLVGAQETKVIDGEAAKAMAASQNIEQRSAVVRAQAQTLLGQCQGGDAAACAAAGNTASIQALTVSTQLSDQLAVANRLQALRLEQESAKRKREINEVYEQHQLVSAYANEELTSGAPTVDSEGFDLTGATGSP